MIRTWLLTGCILVSLIAQSAWAGAAPNVGAVAPNTGPEAGGTAVTITGSNFLAGATVDFGGSAATAVVFVDANTLTCTTPAHAAGAVTVSVTAGGKTGSLPNGFTYGSGGGGGGSTFRFLTTSLPDGSQNAVYAATLLVANAAGPVTFADTGAALATVGMMLDASTGFITGRPTVVTQLAVTFTANDGTTTITFSTTIKISSAGGGGNAGIEFTTAALPDGKVGAAYSASIAVQFNKAPPIFGAADLPPGLSLNGTSGAISGTPTAAGTFYVTLTATDPGENYNKVIVILPLTVLPAASSFRFTNVILTNGQVGSAYSVTLTTSGASGAVTFGASGLPAGLVIDPATGVISGTPTTAGTFLTVVSATSGADTITMNRPVWIAPSATSSFYWVFNGLPSALLNTSYDRQPPIQLITANPAPGGGVSYAASGLPAGITYDATSGQLSGTPSEVGIYPVTFTATNSANGEQLVFLYDFVVLPPNGGDTNSLPVNLWVKKQAIKRTGTAGKDSWAAQLLYNADRRKDRIFDPKTETLSVTLGSVLAINLGPKKLSGDKPKFSYKGNDAAVLPRTNPDPKLTCGVILDESAQTISLTTKAETIPDTVPATFRHTVSLGSKGYKLDEFFDPKGIFVVTAGYRKTAFVVASVKLTAKEANKDALTFSMFLADPSFAYASGTSAMRFRLFNGTTLLADKTFTTLVTGAESTDAKSGVKVFKLKSGKDSATPNTLSKFSYDSKSGKLSLALKNLTLTALTEKEAHVSVEVTIGDKIYFTAVTLFAPKSGSYSTKLAR